MTALIHALACSLSASDPGAGPFDAGLLADLPRLKEYTAARHSSYDRTGG